MKSTGKGLSKFMSTGLEDASRLNELQAANAPMANKSFTKTTDAGVYEVPVPEDSARPTLDLFKSVFSDDSSSSSSEDERVKISEDEQDKEPTNQAQPREAPLPHTYMHELEKMAAPSKIPAHVPAEPQVKLSLASSSAISLVAKVQTQMQQQQLAAELSGHQWVEKTPTGVQKVWC